MSIRSSAGSSIAIATTSGVSTYDAAGFGAKTYVTIDEVTTIGDFGATYNKIEHLPLATRIKKKLKGSKDQGSITIDYAIDEASVGQAQLETASDSDASWAIRITNQSGSVKYFTAQIMSFHDKIGNADSIRAGSAQLEIDSVIVKVAAP